MQRFVAPKQKKIFGNQILICPKRNELKSPYILIIFARERRYENSTSVWWSLMGRH